MNDSTWLHLMEPSAEHSCHSALTPCNGRTVQKDPDGDKAKGTACCDHMHKDCASGTVVLDTPALRICQECYQRTQRPCNGEMHLCILWQHLGQARAPKRGAADQQDRTRQASSAQVPPHTQQQRRADQKEACIGVVLPRGLPKVQQQDGYCKCHNGREQRLFLQATIRSTEADILTRMIRRKTPVPLLRR